MLFGDIFGILFINYKQSKTFNPKSLQKKINKNVPNPVI